MHLESLALYFHVLKFGAWLGEEKTSLSWVGASLLEEPKQSLSDFVALSVNLMRQTPFRSKGLLEIQSPRTIGMQLRRSYSCPHRAWERVAMDDTVSKHAVGIY